MFKNPFKRSEIKEAKKQQKHEADYNLSFGLTTAQEAAIDEQALLHKKEVLLQLTQWQQDRTDVMQRLFLKLCGYAYNKESKTIEKIKWDEGYVSIFGAQKLIGFIETMDRNVMLGNWSDTILIKTLRESIAHPLRRFIFMNRDELSLELQHAEYIFWLMMNTVEPTFWRGWNDGERRKDKEIIKIQELRNPYFKDDKAGVFGIKP